MDIIFNCPNCDQELAVDQSGAGSQIECPSCGEHLTIPSTGKVTTGSLPPVTPPPSLASPIAASAAAKVPLHLKVPVRDTPGEPLIDKPKPPLEAVQKGARRLLNHKDEPGTPYLPPEVLVDVHHGMALMTEETFGPAVGIQPVKDDEEAIRLMNDSRYGLTASIWTLDREAALAIGERVETGTWFMNRCDYLDPALAWTGVKDTGRGVSLSEIGYDMLTRAKSFHLKNLS